MEQKKTLWIIAGVGIFLLVVIGAALILYSPTQTVEPAIASLQVQNDTWTMPGTPMASVRNEAAPIGTDSLSGEVQRMNQAEPLAESSAVQLADGNTGAEATGTQSVEGMTVYSGTTNVYGTGTTTIDLNTLKYNTPTQTSSVTAENQAAANAISSASTAKASNAQSESSASVASSVAPAASTPATSSTAKVASSQKTSTSATTKSTSSASAKTTTKVASAAVSKIPDQYWVQAASFTNKANAEAARAALAENKIDSEIFTYTDSNGKTYYRLRVGPYTTKTEAEYWRSRIVLIDEFADSQSYVTNSSAKKS